MPSLSDDEIRTTGTFDPLSQGGATFDGDQDDQDADADDADSDSDSDTDDSDADADDA